MKSKWITALVLAVCSGPLAAATVEVKVYDAFGSSYSSTRIGEELGALYNLDFRANLVLILGPNLQDERLNRQKDIVDDLDPSEHGVLFAIGTPVESYGRGFSVSPNSAADLLPSADAFRVLVLGPTGEILHEASDVIPRERLLQIVPSR